MITLDQAKYHAHIDSDDEDEILQRHLNGAIQHCINYLNRPVYATEDEANQAIINGEKDAIVFGDELFSAVCIWFTWLTESRRGESVEAPNTAVHSLLKDIRLNAGL